MELRQGFPLMEYAGRRASFFAFREAMPRADVDPFAAVAVTPSDDWVRRAFLGEEAARPDRPAVETR